MQSANIAEEHVDKAEAGVVELEDLIRQIRSYDYNVDAVLVRKAYEYCCQMHGVQQRKSGAPYYSHPIAVAKIVADKELHVSIIVGALLHDLLEDTDVTYSDLLREFGRDTANIVHGVSKLTKLRLNTTSEQQSANLQKLILALEQDDRVILVKLADRLHNMQTLKYLDTTKRRRIAKETMEFYAPIAEQLGLNSWREELEDLAFRALYPRARQNVLQYVAKLRNAGAMDIDDPGSVVERARREVELLIRQKGIGSTLVECREKRPFSIWRKMQRGIKDYSSIFDIYGVRIITRGNHSEDNVYVILGAIHRRWPAVPNRFKDYISSPKPNGYRSVHTTVTYGKGQQIEFQIRTGRMHDTAEYGVAAHWLYRGGIHAPNPYSLDPTRWKSKLSQFVVERANSGDLLKQLREEIQSKHVYCYTPKSDVVWLPAGSTFLDFAYELSPAIGDCAVGAVVNGRDLPLGSPVINGEHVTIITASEPFIDDRKKVSANTLKAGAHLEDLEKRLAFRVSVELGRKTLRAFFEEHGKPLTSNGIRTAAELLRIDGEDELLRRIGNMKVRSAEVLAALYPETPGIKKVIERETGPQFMGLSKEWQHEIASCCNPVPGDRVVGVEGQDMRVAIHAIDCELLKFMDLDNWIDLSWHQGPYSITHPARISATLSNQPGVLGRVCTLIGEQRANISNIQISNRTRERFHFQIEIEVMDLRHLYNVIHSVGMDSSVISVGRYRQRRPDERSES
ncbi:MAG: RelA/SpoT family protein [Rhodobacteraceae bacterium]|nr:RelA/SpoT family protein [Paracoccaceae bacterium]